MQDPSVSSDLSRKNSGYRFQKLRKIKSLKVPLDDGFLFCQETVNLNKNSFTNLYWLELEKSFYKFHIENSVLKKPPIEITRNLQKQFKDRKIMASINTGSFYLTDEGPLPKISSYNLMIKKGEVLQFPQNSRVALVEKKGKLCTILLRARGQFSIDGKKFFWRGPATNPNPKIGEGEVVIYGIFNADIGLEKSTKRKKRKPNIKNSVIHCTGDEVLLGFNLVDKKVSIAEMNSTFLSLFDFIFIVKGKKCQLKDLKRGDKIENVWFGKEKVDEEINGVNGIFAFGPNRNGLEKQIRSEILPPEDSIPRPLQRGYRKSWSILLESKNRIIFFINDARPMVLGQDGLNFFELHEILTQRFDFRRGVCLDSGQSSKLCIKDGNGFKVFGNLHYLDFEHNPPIWDGIQGRAVPSVLIVYRNKLK